MRRAARQDASQAAIVEGLRKAGYRVEIIGRPVDLLVGKLWRESFKGGWGIDWTLMECKTPQKNGKRRPRRDQEAQDRFVEETGTPVVTTLEEALRALEGL